MMLTLLSLLLSWFTIAAAAPSRTHGLAKRSVVSAGVTCYCERS